LVDRHTAIRIDREGFPEILEIAREYVEGNFGGIGVIDEENDEARRQEEADEHRAEPEQQATLQGGWAGGSCRPG
jgi:hypothetical protein